MRVAQFRFLTKKMAAGPIGLAAAVLFPMGPSADHLENDFPQFVLRKDGRSAPWLCLNRDRETRCFKRNIRIDVNGMH